MTAPTPTPTSCPSPLLLAPFAHADAVGVLKGWTVLGLGAFTTALALTVWALRDRLGAPWQAPVVFTAGAVIGLHSWPLVYELFLGNDDLLVLLGVVVAALVWRTGRPVWFGVAVGAICLIKVWPALLIVAVLQAGTGARKRVLAVTALAGVVLVGFISNLVPAGDASSPPSTGRSARPRPYPWSVTRSAASPRSSSPAPGWLNRWWYRVGSGSCSPVCSACG